MARIIEYEGEEYEVSSSLADRLRKANRIISCGSCSSSSRTVYHMADGYELSNIESMIEQDIEGQKEKGEDERKTDWIKDITGMIIKGIEVGDVDKTQAICS